MLSSRWFWGGYASCVIFVACGGTVGSDTPIDGGAGGSTVAAGSVGSCTKKACQCDPTAEAHQRVYVGKSPSECAVIDFTCTGNTTMFSNACGCGCEQDPSCPDWFDCQPSPNTPPCDMADIKRRC